MKHIKLILCITIAGAIGSIDARSRDKAKDVRSERSFDNYVRQGLVVALFYNQEKKPRKKDATEEQINQWEQLKNKNEDLQAMFAAQSKDFLYEEGDLLFITINVANREELARIAKQYNITQFPTIMLFNFGRPIRDMMGSSVQLSGFVGQDQLNAFIKDNIGQKLEERKKEKAEYRKKKLEEAKIRSYYAPYFYWGGPYYGYGYPYYWGWGYPYRWGYWW